ncbi:MAG: sulfate adenylyltransferase [Proteobacteria bacterium]|nr:MAG: sulfate adenylyltransferase [Pseudomonadota bacterium]
MSVVELVSPQRTVQVGADNSGGVLRFITAGSVDDGKSTLIGRLLHDSRAILEDQYSAVARASKRRGQDNVDLSLLTDGLEAEREQGITIDVAYRYFATPRRNFIIADTPGHEQYTRNMVTGASTAEAAVVLIDARKGLLPQSRRHIYLSALLGLSEIVVAINKMDLVGYDEGTFQTIRQEVLEFARGLPHAKLSFVPISALEGDMVVHRGERLGWWQGSTLIEALEAIDARRDQIDLPARLPVQLVTRLPAQLSAAGTVSAAGEPRGYLGRLESGVLSTGQDIVVLPSGQATRIRHILGLDGEVTEAIAGDSITLVLENQLDVSRGDLIAAATATPKVTKEIAARLCWLSADPFEPQRRYWLRHTTRTVRARVRTIDSHVNIHSLELEPFNGKLGMNDIVHAQLSLQQPIACDSYEHNRATGAVILIDEITNQTVAAGLID